MTISQEQIDQLRAQHEELTQQLESVARILNTSVDDVVEVVRRTMDKTITAYKELARIQGKHRDTMRVIDRSVSPFAVKLMSLEQQIENLKGELHRYRARQHSEDRSASGE